VQVARLVPPWDASCPAGLYVCGPAPFVDAARAAASAGGWPESAVRSERFVHDAGPRREDKAFRLRLERSGLDLTVASGQTILEAIEGSGLRPASSCREGVCGTCVCNVVAGEVDHRDAILADLEHRDRRRIAICVSRASGDSLTLDL
jgi:vanillate O-demethylase ferredoxin subunit